ncbi:hypothetical protein C7M84_010297 [Penaeus vannamei]|uniref:Uncharacterized protein n=1 Tax=Penaeus vannamei TaxID=6689 RepID=A0A3R7MWJ4_PENVA|nr:hypothetical protein C7M84_010297 [Penaeus vannamei]
MSPTQNVPTCPQHVPQTRPQQHAQHVPNMSPTCPQPPTCPHTSPTCPQHVLNTSPTCPQHSNVPNTSPTMSNIVLNTAPTCPSPTCPNMSPTFPKHVPQHIPNMSPTFLNTRTYSGRPRPQSPKSLHLRIFSPLFSTCQGPFSPPPPNRSEGGRGTNPGMTRAIRICHRPKNYEARAASMTRDDDGTP